VTPCGECESCRTIAAGSSLDVIEMDAASNRSVDDIRDLRERVGYAPAAGA
jgi:DNA polymerase-3 subunit gamma/tau